jgi:hypothetical protein
MAPRSVRETPGLFYELKRSSPGSRGEIASTGFPQLLNAYGII